MKSKHGGMVWAVSITHKSGNSVVLWVAETEALAKDDVARLERHACNDEEYSYYGVPFFIVATS